MRLESGFGVENLLSNPVRQRISKYECKPFSLVRILNTREQTTCLGIGRC